MLKIPPFWRRFSRQLTKARKRAEAKRREARRAQLRVVVNPYLDGERGAVKRTA